MLRRAVGQLQALAAAVALQAVRALEATAVAVAPLEAVMVPVDPVVAAVAARVVFPTPEAQERMLVTAILLTTTP